MKPIEHRFAELESALFEAAVQPDRWPHALAMLASATGSARGQLIGIGGPSKVHFNWVSDLPERVMEDFMAIDGASARVNYRIAAAHRFPGPEIISEAEYDAVMPGLDGDQYRDFCAQYDLPFGMQTDIRSQANGIIGLAALRTGKDGRSSEEDRTAFATAASLVWKAVRLQLALEAEGMQLVSGALGAMSKTVVLMDALGCVKGVTPQADALLSDGRWMRLVGGQLVAANPGQREELAEAIVGALLGENKRESRSIVLRCIGEDDPLVVDVIALPVREWDMGFRPRLLLSVRTPLAASDESALIAQAFGLSATEAIVALLAAGGLSRAEIATRRQVSPATVTTQIKSIFGKLGVKREAQLVGRIRDFLGRD